MIADLKQPAQNWLADVLTNFGNLMEDGDDPSLELVISGVKMRIQLMELPGAYSREEVVVDVLAKGPGREG